MDFKMILLYKRGAGNLLRSSSKVASYTCTTNMCTDSRVKALYRHPFIVIQTLRVIEC